MPAAENTGAFVSIQNKQEFYSDQYLAEIFDQGLKKTAGQWRNDAVDRDEPGQTPGAALRGLKDEYFQFRDKFGTERDDRKRIALQWGWFRTVLTTLGHKWNPRNLPLENDKEPPVLWTREASGGQRLGISGAYDWFGEGVDPLSLKLRTVQFHGVAPVPGSVLESTWGELTSSSLIGARIDPRERNPTKSPPRELTLEFERLSVPRKPQEGRKNLWWKPGVCDERCQ